MLSCREVHYEVGRLPVLRGADLTVPTGETVALTGVNGSGKTILLELLLGLRRPARGQVRVDRTGGLGVMLQDGGCAPDLTAAEAVRLWLRLHRVTPADPGPLLERVRLAHRASVRSGRLSGGERRRLDLAGALAGDPRVLVLDEPMAALDAEARAYTRAVLTALRDDGRTILLTAHHDDDIRGLADRTVELRDGRIGAGVAR